jgi:hypothetical protein
MFPFGGNASTGLTSSHDFPSKKLNSSNDPQPKEKSGSSHLSETAA